MKRFFSFLLAALVVGHSYAQKRPNIVIIISDDHAYQAIGAYGNPYHATPNMDKLAKEGVLFQNAAVCNSLCGPSRAGLLTGKYSHKNGFKDNHSTFDGSQDSFIKQLHNAGYSTAWIGKWHLETKPQGFDYWKILPGQGIYFNPSFINMDSTREKVKGYATDIITDISTKWLDQRDTSKPFCIVIGHKATHRTWMPDTADLRAYDNVTFPLPANFYDNYEGRYAAAHQDMTIEKTMRLGYDLKMNPDTGYGKENFLSMNPAQRKAYDNYYNPIREEFDKLHLTGRALTEWKYQRYMRDYYATSLSLDRNVGRMMQYIKDKGLESNTIFIYTSDQGFYLGEHGWFDKRFMYDESFKTPLIMRYPQQIKAGAKESQLVMNIDIGPTMLQAAGVPIPKDMQGISLWNMLTKKQPLQRDAIYYHYYEFGEHQVRPHFGVRTSKYKIIRFYGDHDAWELYDLVKDKSEMHNLSDDAAYKKVFTEMQQRLLKAAVQYDDSLAIDLLKKDMLQ